jgi:putative ABC transport system permease protein
MIALTLALRNLWKNRRRSASTLLAIAVGYSAINLFSGYIGDVYRGRKAAAIHAEGLGHLTISKRGFMERGTLDPSKYVFSRVELDRLGRIVRSEPGVELMSPRLTASGLVSNGRISTIFIAEGEEPGAASRLRRFRTSAPQLDPAKPDAGLVSEGLAEMLSVKAGDDVTVFTSTLAGQTNALDLELLGSWNTGTAGTNDKALRLPLAYIQKLLDTDGATRVVVLLDDALDANALRTVLAPRLRSAGFDVEIATWFELSNFYREVKNLFDLIFLFLFSIVFVVVLMSIVNTLTMSVMERVREIGTLRALGMRRGGILRVFAAEGAALGALGCLIGLAITLATAFWINSANIHYIPPASSHPVPLTVGIDFKRLLGSLLFLSAVAMASACWPARRAAKIEIVDALGHV